MDSSGYEDDASVDQIDFTEEIRSDNDVAESETFTLANSRLEVKDGHLIKRGKAGELISRHPLARIESARVIKVFEPIGIVITGGGLILLGLAFFYVENEILDWIFIALGSLACLFSPAGLFSPKLQVVIAGKEVKFDIDGKDFAGDVEAFASSLEFAAESARESVSRAS